ncbi:hypothetical protein Ciccas_013993, partial [Cichlidogyrus casuarinus]
QSGYGGGVCIYFSSEYYDLKKLFSCSRESEILAIFCELDFTKFNICAIYRPPACSKAHDLSIYRHKALEQNATRIVAGDFNLPMHAASYNDIEPKHPILASMKNEGFYQLIDFPTRPASGNILDLCFVANDSSVADWSVTATNLIPRCDHLQIRIEHEAPRPLKLIANMKL